MTGQSWPRRVLRAFWRSLIALSALIAALLLMASLYLSTARGKDWLLRAVLAELNQVLPGHITARSIQQLGLTSVVLEGVVLTAPAGNDVIEAQRVRAEIALAPLWHGHVVLPRVSLETGATDLRLLTDPSAGLLSVFETPSDVPAPATPSDNPLTITIDSLELRDWRVTLPQSAAWNPSALRVSTLRASLAVGAAFDLDLGRLEAEVERGSEALGRFGLQGHLGTQVDSHFEFAGTLCGTETRFDLKLGSSRSPLADWQDLPFELRFLARALTPERLAQLIRDPDLQLPATGPLDIDLQLKGNARRWSAQAGLALPAGQLSIAAQGRELEQLELELQTERLELQQLIGARQAWRLDGVLKASAQKIRDGAALQLQLSSRVALNGVALPPFELRTQLEPGALRELELRLSDQWLTLSLRGNLALDGSTELRAEGRFELEPALRTLRAFGLTAGLEQASRGARGSVSLELELARKRSGVLQVQGSVRSGALELADTQLEQLSVAVLVAGLLPRPTLHVAASWQAARRGSLELTPGKLQIDGEAGRYAFDLRGGALSFGSFATSGWLEQKERETRFLVNASGVLGDVPWRLGMQTASLRADGELELPDVRLEFAGQHAGLHGKYSPRACDLTLEFTRLDLLRVLTPLAPTLALEGLLTGRIRARGSLASPELELELAGDDLVLSPGPKLAASLQAQLDAPRGQLVLHARVRSGTSGGPKPLLDLRWQAHADQAGRVDTELALEDGGGPWIRLLGQLQFEGAESGRLPGLLALPSAALRSIERERWQLELSAEPRPLGRLPLPTRLARLATLVLSARLVAEHQIGLEPRGRLDVQVTDTAATPRSDSCAARALSSKGFVEFSAGRFAAELTAQAENDPLLRVTTSGAFEWSAWLHGRVPRVPDLTLVVAAQHLQLDRLPFVCDRARGELSLNGHVRNALGKGLSAEIDLELDRFSLGSDQTMAAKGKLSLTPAELIWSGTLTAEERTSRFEGRLRQRGSTTGSSPGQRPDVAISVDLDQLPLAPFFPLHGPVSHVSGSVSGRVRVEGSNSNPRPSGDVRLHDVAFTATALAQPLNDINGELRLEDDALVLKHLTARDSSGDLTLDGRVEMQERSAFQAGFDLSARKFPLRQAGQLVASSSVNARIDINWKPGQQDLRVRTRDVNIWLESGRASEGLALDPHPDVIVMQAPGSDPRRANAESSQEGLDEAAPGSSAPNRMLIAIEAKNGFRVERADFSFKLAAQLEVLLERPASPGSPGVSITGEIKFDQGYLELLGKMFQIQTGGVLRFPGGTATILDLVAGYKDRRSEKLVKVHLRGTANAPKLDFLVDETPITAGEAFQLIYGSESSTDRTEDAEADAKQVLSALTAGVITTSIRRRLGAIAPIVAVEPGDSEGAGQVRAGLELDTLIPDFLRDIVTGIYVEGILGGEKQSEHGGDRDVRPGVLVELHFRHNLVTSGRYGPDTTWTIDLGWQP